MLMLPLLLAVIAQAPEPPPASTTTPPPPSVVEEPAAPADAPPATPTVAPPAAPTPAPVPEARQCTLAVLDLEGGDAVATARARALTDVVTGEVSALTPCSVLSRSDIRGILTHEAEKQLLGCASDSCMAELAGALGADYLVTGTVSRIEGSMLLSLRSTDMKSLKVVRRATDSFAGDDAEAIPFVAWLSRKLMTDDASVHGARPIANAKLDPSASSTQSTIWRPMFWTSFTLTCVAGVVTAGAGAATILMSETAKNDVSAANALQDAGPITADVANAGLYATGGLLVVTTVLFFLPAEEPVTP